MELLAALSGAVSEEPDAVRVAGRGVSHAELLARAAAVADEIRGARVVALHATATLETVIGVVGGLLAGVPIAPLPPDSGPAERRHILTDSGAELLLGADGVDAIDSGGPPVDTIDPGGPPVVAIDRLGRSDATGHAEPPPDTTALILYTSGTTGAPKGVLVSRQAIAAGLDALFEAWAWTPDDVVVHGLPLFHVHGLVLGVLGPLRRGSALVHTRRPHPEAYAEAAGSLGGSLYFGVPTVWSRICDDEASAQALQGARLLVSGSAPLPVPVFERLTTLTGHAPIERYGMTETLITVSTRADGERRPGHVGTPIAGVRTRLVGEGGVAVAADGETPGELYVHGPTLFSGYLNRPDATAESLSAGGWFRTGDIATIGPDGWHRIVGRASTDLIKSGGYRIGAGEVENALLAHPGVREAAVVGTPHTDLGEQVTAYVVADGVTEKELTGFVADLLSVHKRPRMVHFVTTLPRNAMGKVVKSRLEGTAG